MNTPRPIDIRVSGQEKDFAPKTELGKKLYALRMQAIASGMKLFSQEEVLEEVKRRRGGAGGHETDLH